MTSASSPDEYVAGLSGWQRALVEKLRETVTAAGDVEEAVKWGHLVYASNGPLLLIRAEEQRVLFGFWRGKRLQSIEPQLKASGKYEMATLDLREGMSVGAAIARRLTKAAIKLNESLGDPRDAAKPAKTARRRKAK
ncbi:MAG TPA: DUF1801 domain-containing protein [Steroidobacteraceae bacterium]|nr:DUF1801 domain-containing protein [Steroidobacteraceae bacterium]